MRRVATGHDAKGKSVFVRVQNGTRHAWRNPGAVDCVLAGAVVGAHAKR